MQTIKQHRLLPPKTSSTVLISFVRGNIQACFPLFDIRSLKTLISSVVYLNMYNPIIVILRFFITSYCTFYALFYILCFSLYSTL